MIEEKTMNPRRSKGAALGLGTVQWGMRYGVANSKGIPSAVDVNLILERARTYGISLLDTAPAYGHAETLIGSIGFGGFKIVTKTPSFKADTIATSYVARLRDSFSQSCIRLGCRKIYGLLVHHAEDLLAPDGGRLMQSMLDLKEEGLVEKIGASVYESRQIDALLARFPLDLVQLPINVLDQRLIHNGRLARLKAEGVEIHARSIFLQGLLPMNLADLNNYFEPIKPLIRRFDDAAASQGMSRSQAAIAFVRDIPEVDAMIVGVESLSQLDECFELYSNNNEFKADRLSCADPNFMNPAHWRLA